MCSTIGLWCKERVWSDKAVCAHWAFFRCPVRRKFDSRQTIVLNWLKYPHDFVFLDIVYNGFSIQYACAPFSIFNQRLSRSSYPIQPSQSFFTLVHAPDFCQNKQLPDGRRWADSAEHAIKRIVLGGYLKWKICKSWSADAHFFCHARHHVIRWVEWALFSRSRSTKATTSRRTRRRKRTDRTQTTHASTQRSIVCRMTPC